MTSKPQVKCFTKFFNRIVSEIETEAKIGKGLAGQPFPDSFSLKENKDLVSTNAIWDTGATATVITKKLADRLGLNPVSFQNITGVNGTEKCPVYIVCLILPNGVYVSDLSVAAVKEIGNEDQDILIGMDIMQHGDLAISNYGGKTTFTFRIPSAREIDFVSLSGKESYPNGMSRKNRREHQRKIKADKRFRR